MIRTPGLQRLWESERNIMANGTAAQKAEQKARTHLGMMVGGAALAMTTGGLLTGMAPSNGEFARTRERLGVKNRSLKIGDTWYDYTQMSGRYALIMSAAADIGEMIMAASNEREMNAALMLQGIGQSIIGNLADHTFMGGFVDVMDVFSARSPVQKAASYTRRQIESIVHPLSAAARGMRTVREDTIIQDRSASGLRGGPDEPWVETVQEEWDRLVQETRDKYFPFLGQESNQYPKIGMFGPLSYHAPTGPNAPEAGHHPSFSYYSPAAFSTEDTRAISQEILRLELNPPWRRSTRVISSGEVGPGGTPLEAMTVEYTPKQNHAWQSKAAELAYRMMTEQMNTARYRKAVDEEKAQMLMDKWDEANRTARDWMESRDPEWQSRREQIEALLNLRVANQRRDEARQKALARMEAGG